MVNTAKIKMPSGAEKELLVKADEKTRGRLDEYEKERVQNQVRIQRPLFPSNVNSRRYQASNADM